MVGSTNYTVGRLTPFPMEPPLLAPEMILTDWTNHLFWRHRDPRLMEYPLMKSTAANAAIILIYLLIVYFGPKLMKYLQPFSLKWPLVIYNLGMVATSGYILFEAIYTAYLSSYTMFCQPVDFSNHPLAVRMAKAVWLYFFTRYVEFIDTIFFILRKKQNQISFLHVYHHCSVAITWWFTANLAPGGMMVHMVMLNCFIHVIMYTYYGLSAIGPWMQKYLWWKVHLTKLQLIQFVCMLILMGTNTTCNDPNFPQQINYVGVVYCSTILGLFLNFYIQEYILKKNKAKAVGSQNNGKAMSNGVSKNEINGSCKTNGSHSAKSSTNTNGNKHHAE